MPDWLLIVAGICGLILVFLSPFLLRWIPKRCVECNSIFAYTYVYLEIWGIQLVNQDCYRCGTHSEWKEVPEKATKNEDPPSDPNRRLPSRVC